MEAPWSGGAATAPVADVLLASFLSVLDSDTTRMSEIVLEALLHGGTVSGCRACGHQHPARSDER